MKVIVDSRFGDFRVYSATIENAKKLMDCNLSNFAYKELAQHIKNGRRVVAKEFVTKIFNKILSEPVGAQITKTIVNSDEIKKEVMSFCIEHQLSINWDRGGIEVYPLFRVFKVNLFSFFVNNENYPADCIFVYEEEIKEAKTYLAIIEDKWPEKASDMYKISTILEFVEGFCHRDVKYVLADFQEKI